MVCSPASVGSLQGCLQCLAHSFTVLLECVRRDMTVTAGGWLSAFHGFSCKREVFTCMEISCTDSVGKLLCELLQHLLGMLPFNVLSKNPGQCGCFFFFFNVSV